MRRGDTDEFLQVKAEAGSGTVAPEHGADFVVPATAHQCVGSALGVDGKTCAAVIGVAAKVGQVEGDGRAGEMAGQPLQISQRFGNGGG